MTNTTNNDSGLNLDHLEALAPIGRLIATQDNRITEAPIFVVEQKTPVISDSDYNDCRVEWRETEKGDYQLASPERAARLEELHRAGRDTPGWRRHELTDIWTFVTACFTEQGCIDYLARNGHNLSETRIYAYGSYRNEEFRTVRNALIALARRAAPVSAPIAGDALRAEAAKLAPILRGMCEGGDVHGDGVDIYADDYMAGDGDTYVVRAAALLEQVAALANQPAPTVPATHCAHVWNDFGQLGGRNVSWCPRCDVLAWTGKEPAPTAAPEQQHLPGWERGIATVTMTCHQLREALEFINPDNDPELLDDWLTFGIVQHKDDEGNATTGLCCWNEDSDGVLPLDGEPAPAAMSQPSEAAPLTDTERKALNKILSVAGVFMSSALTDEARMASFWALIGQIADKLDAAPSLPAAAPAPTVPAGDEKALFAAALREYDRHADDGIVGLRWNRAEGHVWRSARALAHQPAQEQAKPVAWMDPKAGCAMDAFLWQPHPGYSVPVYTRAAPSQAAQHEAGAKIDVRHEFEMYKSRLGEAANYIGDGLYGNHGVTDQANAFRAGVEVGLAASPVVRAQSEESARPPMLSPLDYRAQGREEALAIILAESAEDPFSEYIGWSKSGAPEDEGDSHWKEDKLRELLHIGDRTHDAYDRAEGAYWEALGRKDEAARELLFAQQAPFYKPLHDFLSKHEAWDLMADLKRPAAGAQQAHAGADEALAAARWRAFLDSARIRILGSAGIKSDTAPDGTPHNGYAHFGMEIWTKYGTSLSPEQLEQMRANNESAREVLTKYADIAIEAQRAAIRAAQEGGAAC